MTHINDRDAHKRDTRNHDVNTRDVYARDYNNRNVVDNRDVVYDRDGYPSQYTNQDMREPMRPPSGSVVTKEADTGRKTLANQTAYHNGYVQGRELEQRRYRTVLATRDNDNAARGLLLGILLTSLVGIVVGILFAVNQRNRVENSVEPVAVPGTVNVVPAAPASPTATQSPQVRERVIERIVPVPQDAPDNVNITVPNGQSSGTQSSGQSSGTQSSGQSSGQTAQPSPTATQSNPSIQSAPTQAAPAGTTNSSPSSTNQSPGTTGTTTGTTTGSPSQTGTAGNAGSGNTAD